jgi:hypothetical protein
LPLVVEISEKVCSSVAFIALQEDFQLRIGVVTRPL